MDKLLSGRRVLVIEDEMLIFRMIEGMLDDLGCEFVTSAATINQALTLIEERTFDAAMLDVNLKGSNSRAVADALAARGVPFAFSTGNSGDLMEGHDNRIVLRKPFSAEAFAAVLGEILTA